MWPFSQTNKILKSVHNRLDMEEKTESCTQAVKERLRLLDNPMFQTDIAVILIEDADVFSVNIKFNFDDEESRLNDVVKELTSLETFLSYGICGVDPDGPRIDFKAKCIRILMGPGYGLPWCENENENE